MPGSAQINVVMTLHPSIRFSPNVCALPACLLFAMCLIGGVTGCRDNNHPHRSLMDAAIDAIREQRLTDLDNILTTDPSIVNRIEPAGVTLLYRALVQDNVEVSRVLLKHGADPNQLCNYLRPIQLALHPERNGAGYVELNIEMISLLLESGARLDVPDGFGNLPTDEGIARLLKGADSRLLRLCLEAGLSPNATMKTRRSDRISVLSEAVLSGNLDVVQQLIDAGANVNAVDSFGRTALHYAAEDPSLDAAVGLLIESGASEGLMDSKGLTPCAIAQQKQNSVALELFQCAQ